MLHLLLLKMWLSGCWVSEMRHGLKMLRAAAAEVAPLDAAGLLLGAAAGDAPAAVAAEAAAGALTRLTCGADACGRGRWRPRVQSGCCGCCGCCCCRGGILSCT